MALNLLPPISVCDSSSVLKGTVNVALISFHSVPDTFTIAKHPDARSIWQKANNCQHRQKNTLYKKIVVLTEVLEEGSFFLRFTRELLCDHSRQPDAHIQPPSSMENPRPCAHALLHVAVAWDSTCPGHHAPQTCAARTQTGLGS